MQDSDETNGLPQSPELLKPKPKAEQSSEKGRVMVTEAMRDIKETEQFVGHTTSASGAELTAATDDALVFVADETVKSADQDGVRTDVEKVDIRKSLQAVVVEGAMVESGNRPTTSDNPIVSLDKAGRDKEVTAMIKELKAEGAKLPTGEDVALMAELARINRVGYGANVGTGDESGDEKQVEQEQVDEDENEPEPEVDDGEPDLDSDDTNEMRIKTRLKPKRMTIKLLLTRLRLTLMLQGRNHRRQSRKRIQTRLMRILRSNRATLSLIHLISWSAGRRPSSLKLAGWG